MGLVTDNPEASMHQELLQPYIIREDYDPEHTCITITELRWLLNHLERHGPYWTYFVLRITTGMRPDEANKLTLYDLTPDLTTITYRVDKPSTVRAKDQGYIQQRKHRRVVLDPWVRDQLRAYLNRTCRNVNGIYISPHPHQRLFPWKNMQVIGTYWYKLRKSMHAAGFESHRMIRAHHHLRTGRTHRVYVVRPHILRHFSASVMYYRLGDLASVRDWIKHEDTEITNGYLHSANALGTTPDYLRTATWADILGYDEDQTTLPLTAIAPAQTSLANY